MNRAFVFMGTRRLIRIPYVFMSLLLSAAAASCSRGEVDEGLHDGGVYISFSGAVSAVTRGAVTDASTLSSIGLLGYYTDTETWAQAYTESVPDFMYNTQLTRNNGTWSYSPVKYWPLDGHYLTFFGYSPHSAQSSVAGNLALTAASHTGAPSLTYRVEDSVPDQVDLLWAEPLYDRQRTASPLLITLNHAMTRLGFQAVFSPAEADRGYTATVKSIVLSGIGNSGTLDLSDGSWTVGTEQHTYTIDADSGLNTVSGNNVFDSAVPEDYTTRRNLLADGDYAFMMPQMLSPSAMLTLNVEFAGNGNDEEVAFDFPIGESAGNVWEGSKGFTYYFTLNGRTVLLDVVEWTDQGTSTVVDGQNYLTVSASELEFDKWGNPDVRVTIESNLAEWSAALSDDTQTWLMLKDDTDTEVTALNGYASSALRFVVDQFEGSGSRENGIVVTAGNMNMYISVRQDDSEAELRLLLSASELIFAGRQYDSQTGLWSAPSPQHIEISYSPAEHDYSISLLPHSGGGVGDIEDVIGATSSSDSEIAVTLEAISPQSPDVMANPYFERSSRLTFKAVNSAAETVTKTVLVRQIFYSLVIDGPERIYYMKEGTYDYTLTANSPWVATVDDTYGVFSNITLPLSGGTMNTVATTSFSFTINPLVDNDTQATITISSPDMLFPPQTMLIEAQRSIPNSIIVLPGSAIEIAVRKPYKVWRTDPDLGGLDIENDISGESEAVLVWQDAKNLISSVSLSGEGKDAMINVQTGSAAEGNAVVAFKKGGTIYWSWHLWVTDYDPLASAITATHNGVEYTVMDRNLGAFIAAPPLDTGGVLDETEQLRMLGLFFQNSRKDPFPPSTSFTSNQMSFRREVYDINNTVVPIRQDFSTSDIPNLDNSIMNPDTYYTGNYGNASWYGNLLDMRTSLWEPVKTDYDPCPTGWQVPPLAFWQGRESSSYLFSNYSVYLEGVGYVPIQGYIFSDFSFSDMGNLFAQFGTRSGDYPRAFVLFSSSAGLLPRPAVGANVRCVKRN